MRSSAQGLLALAVVLSCTSVAEAQQRRATRPYQGQAPIQSQYVPRQQQQTPRVAARPRSGPDRGPALDLPRGEDVVKQEVLATIISQVVLGGLDNPTAIVIQPKSNEIFIAEAGSGVIGRLNDVPGKYALEPVIDGFETAEDESTGGIQSIVFGDKSTLTVACRGGEDEQALVHFFRIPPAGSITAADSKSTLQVAPEGEALHPEALALEYIGGKLFAVGRGEAMRGFLCDMEWNESGETGCSLITNRPGEVNRPTAVVPGVRGQILVANMGEANDQADSTILIYDPQSGRTLASVATGLCDLVALAVSPKSGRLYGLDMAGNSASPGGLYRLDLKNEDGEMVCKPARMMTLDRPTGMAFRPDGELLITTKGTHSKEYEGGLLVRIYNDSEL